MKHFLMKHCAPAEGPVGLPDWYWRLGLHDAVIALVEPLERWQGDSLRGPYRNCLKLHLDASDARESDIRDIALYDYELLCGDLPQPGSWWQGDRLRRENGKYILETEWTDNREMYFFAVGFLSAEVERR